MSLTIINDEYLNDIADALRELHGEDETVVYKPSEMAPRVQDYLTADARLIAKTYEGDYTNNGIVKVRPNAFAYLNLNNVELLNATSLGEYAFSYSNIVSITIPKISVIPKCGFYSCKKLVNVDFSHLIQIQASGFEYCTLLGRNSHINCPLLRYIDETAFILSGITSIHLPSIETIGYYAFYDTPLNTLILSGYTVPTLGEEAISNNNPSLYIYVPRSMINEYLADENWSVYANKFRAIEDYPEIQALM